jgi:hypothetical protein
MRQPQFDLRSGGRIAWCICGSRPFPELGPPGTPAEHDLLKLIRCEGVDVKGKSISWWFITRPGEGSWFCPRPRRLEQPPFRFQVTQPTESTP